MKDVSARGPGAASIGMRGLLVVLAVGASRVSGEEVDFNREIRPILAGTCLKCHGGVRQESDLSLLYRESALRPAASGKAAIVPGKPDESELLRRVTAADPADRMPPKGLPLPASAIHLLRGWISAGAPYTRHWALDPPVPQDPPRVDGSAHAAWARSGIDAFILERLEREGLEPSPPAEKGALLRRVSLDLTGLPPTVEELRAFLADESSRAYEDVVERLLASTRFGERWARVWLDIARYADTQGYEKDNQRTIWRYRDWVIDAFNRDLPYDQFTVEQLAGDLLPDATTDQLIATAFHRNTMTNTEGGTDDEEFRTAAVVDRINSTLQTWMGLTFGCTQCHNHPYDPILQEDYYRVFAIFNQTADNDQPDESPTIVTPTAEQSARMEELEAVLASLRSRLAAPSQELREDARSWEEVVRGATSWTTLRPVAHASSSGATLCALDDGSVLASGPASPNDTYTLTLEAGAPARVAAIRLEALTDRSLPKGGPGRADDGNFVLSHVDISRAPGSSAGVKSGALLLVGAAADFSQDGFPVANALGDADRRKTGWAIQPQAGQAHEAVFLLSEPFNLEAGDRIELRLEQAYERPGFTLGRFRLSATADSAALERRRTPAEVLAIAAKASDARSEAEAATLLGHYRTIAPRLQPLRDETAAREAELRSIRPPTTPILRELPADRRRKTHILIRGSFLAPGKEVEAGVPRIFGDLPPDTPRNRLDFAHWLMSGDNPLSARVAVNRFWEQLFGTGLVETSEDFGTQGASPSHPELIDWLAIRFRNDLRFSVKALLRELVSSATYRQSSSVTPALLEKDPKNVLLARGPRFRIEAEMVRDQALSIAGLLSPKLHGPSVMPPQPEGVWQVVYSSDQWVTPKGADRYRRGIYTFWRRTSPYPSMIAFDATSREVCTIRRPRTNTPLQALVTLNDPVYVEAAQALARRAAALGDLEAGLEEAFLAVLSRRPEPAETARLRALHEAELAAYRQDPEGAAAMASDPFGPAPDNADLANLAAWTVVSGVLLNLDELLTKG